MKKTYCLIILSLLLSTLTINAQKKDSKNGTFKFLKDYVNRIVNDTVSQEESQFFTYPVVGYRPETGVEFGASPFMSFMQKKTLLTG